LLFKMEVLVQESLAANAEHNKGMRVKYGLSDDPKFPRSSNFPGDQVTPPNPCRGRRILPVL